MEKKIEYSLIIPIFNEHESVNTLFLEIKEVFLKINKSYEIIFINDGSTDQSEDVINKITQNENNCEAIHLRRNFGKSIGYMHGFTKAKGEYIVTLDGDLQDDPNELHKLIKEAENNYDLVIGAKENRLETEISKKLPSMIFNYFLSKLFKIKLCDSNSGFRLIKKTVADTLDLYGDRYRFIPQLCYLSGFTVKEVPVVHRKRKYGHSKYGIKRFWTGAIDIIGIKLTSSFKEKPLQFFMSLAVAPLTLGMLLEVYVLITKLMGDTFREHLAAMISGVFLILIAVQIISVGILGEIVITKRKAFLEKREK